MGSFKDELQNLKLVCKTVKIICGNNIKNVTIVKIGDNFIQAVEVHSGHAMLFPLANIEVIEILNN